MKKKRATKKGSNEWRALQGLKYERKINGLGSENFRFQIVADRLGRCRYSLKSFLSFGKVTYFQCKANNV